MKPSNYTGTRPIGSVLQKSEPEWVARNIMIILSRTANEWRKMSFDEYREERLKDVDFTQGEEKYFNQVIDYCISPDTAKLFSPSWRSISK